MIVRGKFETYPDHIHKLWKEVYFIWGKDAPQKYREWWGSRVSDGKYYSLLDAIVVGGILDIPEETGAFYKYSVWGILEYKLDSYDHKQFTITDKYIDFLGTI